MHPASTSGSLVTLGAFCPFRESAGGRITPAVMEALGILGILADNMPGPGDMQIELVVMHHTDCGLTRFTNPAFQQQAMERLGLSVDEVAAISLTTGSKCLTQLDNDLLEFLNVEVPTRSGSSPGDRLCWHMVGGEDVEEVVERFTKGVNAFNADRQYQLPTMVPQGFREYVSGEGMAEFARHIPTSEAGA